MYAEMLEKSCSMYAEMLEKSCKNMLKEKIVNKLAEWKNYCSTFC